MCTPTHINVSHAYANMQAYVHINAPANVHARMYICAHTCVHTCTHLFSPHQSAWLSSSGLLEMSWGSVGGRMGQDQSSDVMASKPSCSLSTIRKNWSAEGVAPRPRAHFLPVLRGRMQWVRGKLVLPQLWLISRSLLHVCPQWPPITPWHMPICSPGLGRCGHPGACEGRPQMAHSSLSSAQKLEDLG